MLDALVYRKNRDVTRATQPAGAEEALEGAEHSRRAIREREDPVHEIRTGQMQLVFRDGLALVLEKSGRIRFENRLDSTQARIN